MLLQPNPELLERIITPDHGDGSALPSVGTAPLPDELTSTHDTQATVGRTRLSRRPAAALTRRVLEEAFNRRGRVKVPWRLVSSPAYPDPALSVYIKIAALGWRPEGCTAGVTVLSSYLRLSPSTVERGLRALSRPDPTDGVVELTSRRRTKTGGLGTTAERRVRELRRQEPFVWVPVIAAELLEPRQLRAWAALAYADARGMHVSQAQLGEVLLHHSGKRAGKPIGAGSASAVVDSLEALGWLRVHRREGLQGRHLYEVLERPGGVAEPLELGRAPEQTRERSSASCRVGDGSGYEIGDGSLATEEDPQIDRRVHEGELNSSAVGEAQVVAHGFGQRSTRSHIPVSSSAPALALRAERLPSPSSKQPTPHQDIYTGPALTFSPLLALVMEPVKWLIQRVSVYVQRSFARQIGSQLADGVEPQRLRARLESRFARTSPQDMRNVAGWLLKVAAVRWGCHDPQCEEGVRWHSGEQCPECLAVRLEQRTARQRQGLLNTGLCPDCRCQLNENGRCQICQPAPVVPRHKTYTNPGAVSVEGSPHHDNRPSRCLDCASWAEDLGRTGRCRCCTVQAALRKAETEAMDAAGAGLAAGKKIIAAHRACTDVRRRVAAARHDALTAGLDQEGQDARVVAAAIEAAQSWMATP